MDQTVGDSSGAGGANRRVGVGRVAVSAGGRVGHFCAVGQLSNCHANSRAGGVARLADSASEGTGHVEAVGGADGVTCVLVEDVGCLALGAGGGGGVDLAEVDGRGHGRAGRSVEEISSDALSTALRVVKRAVFDGFDSELETNSVKQPPAVVAELAGLRRRVAEAVGDLGGHVVAVGAVGGIRSVASGARTVVIEGCAMLDRTENGAAFSILHNVISRVAVLTERPSRVGSVEVGRTVIDEETGLQIVADVDVEEVGVGSDEGLVSAFTAVGHVTHVPVVEGLDFDAVVVVDGVPLTGVVDHQVGGGTDFAVRGVQMSGTVGDRNAGIASQSGRVPEESLVAVFALNSVLPGDAVIGGHLSADGAGGIGGDESSFAFSASGRRGVESAALDRGGDGLAGAVGDVEPGLAEVARSRGSQDLAVGNADDREASGRAVEMVSLSTKLASSRGGVAGAVVDFDSGGFASSVGDEEPSAADLAPGEGLSHAVGQRRNGRAASSSSEEEALGAVLAGSGVVVDSAVSQHRGDGIASPSDDIVTSGASVAYSSGGVVDTVGDGTAGCLTNSVLGIVISFALVAGGGTRVAGTVLDGSDGLAEVVVEDEPGLAGHALGGVVGGVAGAVGHAGEGAGELALVEDSEDLEVEGLGGVVAEEGGLRGAQDVSGLAGVADGSAGGHAVAHTGVASVLKHEVPGLAEAALAFGAVPLAVGDGGGRGLADSVDIDVVSLALAASLTSSLVLVAVFLGAAVEFAAAASEHEPVGAGTAAAIAFDVDAVLDDGERASSVTVVEVA